MPTPYLEILVNAKRGHCHRQTQERLARRVSSTEMKYKGASNTLHSTIGWAISLTTIINNTRQLQPKRKIREEDSRHRQL